MSRAGDRMPSQATTRSALERRAPLGPLGHDADHAVAVLHQLDDRVLVDDRQVALERLDQGAEADGHGDRRLVGARRDRPPRRRDLVVDADLLEGLVALEAEHVAARDVVARGHPLEHDGLEAAEAQQAGEGHPDHPAADDHDSHHGRGA